MRFVDGCDMSGVVSHANGRGEDSLNFSSEHPFRVGGKVLSGNVLWYRFGLLGALSIGNVL